MSYENTFIYGVHTTDMDVPLDNVTQQPGKQVSTHMVKPEVPGGCPAGLEYLSTIDQVICKQETHLLEVFCPWEKNNRFRVYNTMGQQVYIIEEDTSCAMRWFCGAARGFTYRVKDNSNKEVLTFERRFQCCSGCCWCADSDSCAWELEVRAGTERLGSVRQMKSLWKPYMSIILNDGDTFGEFRGPCCVCSCCGCCGDVEFPLFASDSFIIGKVSKQWTGTAREFFTDSDNFSCTFPLDMTVNGKACILAAAFLIDMMFFEQN